MIRNIGKENSLFNQFLAEIRDVAIQKDSMRFRHNVERVGEIFAYEISKELHYIPQKVKTPLGETTIQLPEEQPVIATILRAGLPFHKGMLNYFDKAECAFIKIRAHLFKNHQWDHLSTSHDKMPWEPIHVKIEGLIDQDFPCHYHLYYKKGGAKGIPDKERTCRKLWCQICFNDKEKICVKQEANKNPFVFNFFVQRTVREKPSQ